MEFDNRQEHDGVRIIKLNEGEKVVAAFEKPDTTQETDVVNTVNAGETDQANVPKENKWNRSKCTGRKPQQTHMKRKWTK